MRSYSRIGFLCVSASRRWSLRILRVSASPRQKSRRTLAQGPCQHLQVVGQTGVDAQRGRWFEPAMHHAVLAPRIVAGAVTFPGRLGHQAFECLVMAVRDEITGAFPALHVIGGVSPCRAREVVLATEELEVERSLAHSVLFGDAGEV